QLLCSAAIRRGARCRTRGSCRLPRQPLQKRTISSVPRPPLLASFAGANRRRPQLRPRGLCSSPTLEVPDLFIATPAVSARLLCLPPSSIKTSAQALALGISGVPPPRPALPRLRCFGELKAPQGVCGRLRARSRRIQCQSGHP
ncbi:hypothetical protein HK405_002412, partial [Cladochytrium tenue]